MIEGSCLYTVWSMLFLASEGIDGKLAKNTIFRVKNAHVGAIEFISRADQEIHAQGCYVNGEVWGIMNCIHQKPCSYFIGQFSY